MSDPMQKGQDLSQAILAADGPTWKQIQKALGVKTRKEAANLVQTNPEAAAAISQLLSGAGAQGGSLATGGAPVPTLMTGAAQSAPTLLPKKKGVGF